MTAPEERVFLVCDEGAVMFPECPWYYKSMDFAFVYLVQRFFYRLFDFFHHWYADGSRRFAHAFISALESADRTFAVKITMRHFFEPLYKDYSAIGRILGIIFRTGRVLIGAIVYFVVACIFAVAYLVWLAIPAVILFYAARNL